MGRGGAFHSDLMNGRARIIREGIFHRISGRLEPRLAGI